MTDDRKYRKKPVVIEAVRWTGTEACLNEVVLPFLADGHEDFEHLPRAPDDPHIHQGIGFTPPSGELFIPTLEGTMTANPGDWIIGGIKGEFYPCKPDIFAATYEPASTALAEPSETDEEQADVRAAWFEVQQHLCPQQAGGYSSYFEAAKVIVQMHTAPAEQSSPYHYEIRGQHVICMCDKCVISRDEQRGWVPVGDAAIIEAAKELTPLLEQGWDEYDESADQMAGSQACDKLVAAVRKQYPAPPSEPKEG